MKKILVSLAIIAAASGCGGSTLGTIKSGLAVVTGLIHSIFDDAQRVCSATGNPDKCQAALERMELVAAAYETALRDAKNPEEARQLASKAVERMLAERLRMAE